MTARREVIMQALLSRLQTKCGAAFATYSRRMQMYDDLIQQLQNGTAPKFPALYTYDGVGFGGGITRWDQGGQSIAGPVKRIMNVTLVIYALKPSANTPNGPDMTDPGAVDLYPLIELVEDALDDDSENNQYGVLTLGGLCRRCWIEGEGFLIPGDIDTTGLTMQTIPVRILIP